MTIVELKDLIGCLIEHPIKNKIINANRYFLILVTLYFLKVSLHSFT